MNKKLGKNNQYYSPVQEQARLVENNSSDSSYEMTNLAHSNTSEEKCSAGQSESDSQSILSKMECSYEKKRRSLHETNTKTPVVNDFTVNRSQMLSNEMRTLSLSTIFSQRATIHPISLNNPFDQFLKCYNLQSDDIDQLRPCFASNSLSADERADHGVEKDKSDQKSVESTRAVTYRQQHQNHNVNQIDPSPESHSSNDSEYYYSNKAVYASSKSHSTNNYSDQINTRMSERAIHYPTVSERIDMDQPRSHSVPYKEGHRTDVGPIGGDFSFLKRIYYNREEKYSLNNNIKCYNQNDMILNRSNYHQYSSYECEQFRNDIRTYLQKKSGVVALNSNMNNFIGNIKISKYIPNTNTLGNRNTYCSSNIVFNDIAKDQEGSRFLQKRLDQSDETVWKYLLSNLNILDLCTDLFGNYVIQKLIDNFSCRTIIGEMILDKLVDLSTNTFGCRVVQKLIIFANKEDYNSHSALTTNIISKLAPHLLTLVYDANGNHVVQRIVALYSKKQPPQLVKNDGIGISSNGPDIQSVCSNDYNSNEQYGKNAQVPCLKSLKETNMSNMFENECIILAKHKYGCRVLQKIIETSINHSIIDKLIEQSIDLAENQYGNYVLQHIIGINFEHCKKITEKIIPRLYEYSTHKFASNVIETIIHALYSYKLENIARLEKTCESESLKRLEPQNKHLNNSIVSDDITVVSHSDNNENKKQFNVLDSTPDGLLVFVVSALNPHILSLSTDKYGNYVVQRILETDKGYMIKNELIKNIGLLKGQVYAKGIVNKVRL